MSPLTNSTPSSKPWIRCVIRFRWWILSITLFLGVLFLPAPIGGCYWEIGDWFNTFPGHSFTYFGDGQVYSCHEYSTNATSWGPYQYQEGIGWVLVLRKSERRILVKPHLLFATFESLDTNSIPATAPFQWRDPLFWKTREILKSIHLNPAPDVTAASR
jgi:hypothetical protein